MTEVELLDIIPLIITFAIGALLVGGGLWKKIKSAIKNLGKIIYDLGLAIEDDAITKEEILQTLENIKKFLADITDIRKLLGV